MHLEVTHSIPPSIHIIPRCWDALCLIPHTPVDDHFWYLADILLFFFDYLIYFNLRIISLQYCDGLCHTSTWICHRNTCVPSPWNPLPPSSPVFPSGVSQSTALGALLHALDLYWSSVLHMVIHMLQCYSLKSSHLHLFSQNPKVCSLHLCLFCWSAYRMVVTIILNSIYMH